MSHFSQIKQGRIRSKSQNIRTFWILTVCAVMAAFLALGPSAHAATTGVYTKTTRNPSYVLKTDLAAMAGQDTAVLDWRVPRYTLRFDLPAHDWYDNLDLFLSAVPQGGVNPKAPLLVSYNGAKAVPLYAEGSRFDAHIRLDPARIRTSRNEITISYQDTAKISPREGLVGRCLQESDGQWILKLSGSKLAATARAKPRSLQIREIEQRLAHPMTAPSRVAIIAKGKHKTAYEALAAQGIGLRAANVPAFTFTNGSAPFEVLIGLRSEITNTVSGKTLLGESGSRLFVDTNKTPRIVLTADTEDELLKLTRAFAAYHMPSARRAVMSEYEFYSGRKLSAPKALDGGKHILSTVGTAVFQHSWNPPPAQINFNAKGGNADSGVLTLGINADPSMNPKSRLTADLNGRSIGYTYLDRKKKFVTFNIPQGVLKPADNTLTLAPALEANADQTACLARHIPPALQITDRSTIKIGGSAHSGLANFAAAGVRSKNEPQTVVITAKTSRDRAAALHVLAFAARQVGPVFASATYTDTLSTPQGDALIIGPNALKNAALLAAAPRAAQMAMRGEPLSDPNGKAYAADKFASLNATDTIRMAASSAKARKIRSGGIAAIFASPYSAGNTVTVISATNASDFAASASALSAPEHWNALRGGVVRWNKTQIVMAQAETGLPAVPTVSAAVTAQSKLNGWKTKLAALLPSRNTQKPAPQQTTPQPAAKAQPIATAPSAPISLRGASSPARVSVNEVHKMSANTQGSSSLPNMKLPKISMPDFKIAKPEFSKTNFDISSEFAKAKRSVQQSYGEIMSGQFFRKASNFFDANRQLSLILAAFAGLILIGFAVPKPSN